MPKLNLGIRFFSALLKLIRFKNGFSFNRLMKNNSVMHQVNPPRFIQRVFDCQKNVIDGHPVWTIQPKKGTPTNHILFFHGGAYVQTFTYFHWRFIAQIVLTQGCAVHAPNYPLAPQSKANETIHMTLRTYQHILAQDSCEKIILMGDSAGGGLALALTQLIRDQELCPPVHTIMLSPWLDIRLNNPVIPEIDKVDPLLKVEGLIEAGRSYAGELPPDHPFVSPITGNLENLPPISIFIGTHDILYPDCVKLKNELQALGNQGIYYEAEGMLHDWVLYPLLASLDSRLTIFKIIRESFQQENLD